MDKKTFDSLFSKNLRRLVAAEKITRALVAEMSRSLLQALHNGVEGVHGDIAYINKFVGALTPVNKRVARLYFAHFSGFMYDDVLGAFSKKSKKKYDECKALANALLEDPNQNLWTWAERHVDIEKKPFDTSKVTQYIQGVLKKAEKEGVSELDILKAVIAGGIHVETVIGIMDSLGYEAHVEGEEQPVKNEPLPMSFPALL